MPTRPSRAGCHTPDGLARRRAIRADYARRDELKKKMIEYGRGRAIAMGVALPDDWNAFLTFVASALCGDPKALECIVIPDILRGAGGPAQAQTA